MSIISDWLSSNSEEQSKSFITSPKLPTDLLVLNPKPPDEDNEGIDTFMGAVAMDWGNEERNLASKVYTSQRPSTSIIVPTNFLLGDSDNIKKTEAKGLSMRLKYGRSSDNVTNVRTTSSQVTKDENTDRVHWEPPCEQSTHHQE